MTAASVPRGVPLPRLPAGPLLEAIEARRLQRGTTLLALLGERGASAQGRARQEGTVTVRKVADLCGLLGVAPQAVYGDAYDQAASAPLPTRATRVPEVRLPAAPLLAAVKARCRPRAGEVDAWSPDQRPAVEEVLGTEPARRAYYRAEREGALTLRALERLCDAFGWHPRMLYGDAYDEAAFSGSPEDHDPWEGLAA